MFFFVAIDVGESLPLLILRGRGGEGDVRPPLLGEFLGENDRILLLGKVGETERFGGAILYFRICLIYPFLVWQYCEQRVQTQELVFNFLSRLYSKCMHKVWRSKKGRMWRRGFQTFFTQIQALSLPIIIISAPMCGTFSIGRQSLWRALLKAFTFVLQLRLFVPGKSKKAAGGRQRRATRARGAQCVLSRE